IRRIACIASLDSSCRSVGCGVVERSEDRECNIDERFGDNCNLIDTLENFQKAFSEGFELLFKLICHHFMSFPVTLYVWLAPYVVSEPEESAPPLTAYCKHLATRLLAWDRRRILRDRWG